MLNEGLTGFAEHNLPCVLTSAWREQQLHFQGHDFMLAVVKTTAQGLRQRKAKRYGVGGILLERYRSPVGRKRIFFALLREKISVWFSIWVLLLLIYSFLLTISHLTGSRSSGVFIVSVYFIQTTPSLSHCVYCPPGYGGANQVGGTNRVREMLVSLGRYGVCKVTMASWERNKEWKMCTQKAAEFLDWKPAAETCPALWECGGRGTWVNEPIYLFCLFFFPILI